MKKIESMIESGSTVKNTDLLDRGLFLSCILKHVDDSIWEKVDKDQYMHKFASIGVDCSFEEVSSVWGTQLLAE